MSSATEQTSEDPRLRTGLLDAVGEEHVFPTVDAAVSHAETREDSR